MIFHSDLKLKKSAAHQEKNFANNGTTGDAAVLTAEQRDRRNEILGRLDRIGGTLSKGGDQTLELKRLFQAILHLIPKDLQRGEIDATTGYHSRDLFSARSTIMGVLQKLDSEWLPPNDSQQNRTSVPMITEQVKILRSIFASQRNQNADPWQVKKIIRTALGNRAGAA